MVIKFSHRIKTIDSGECLRDLNLLAHAQLVELDIGSECGGHGKCGKDRLMLPFEEQKKVNRPTEIEKVHFSPAELTAGWRLACQCFPEKNGDAIIAQIPFLK